MARLALARVKNVDDVLGPAESRFLASGYRRIERELRDVTIGVLPAGGLGARSVASLRYPRDWSTKSNGSPRPHLSTVDAFVIAVQLAEAFLLRVYGLDEEDRRWSWIRRCELRSGAAPQVDLDSFEVTARLAATKRASRQAGSRCESHFECSVGTIRVILVIEHPLEGVAPKAETFDGIDDVLGARTERFYEDGFRRRELRVEDLDLSADPQRVSAVVTVGGDGARWDLDIEGAYRPAVSILDCILAQAQLGQVLLYTLDDVERSESNTLWMRRVVAESPTPYRSPDHPFSAVASISSARVIALRGASWRIADFTGFFHGFAVTYSLAHELPN